MEWARHRSGKCFDHGDQRRSENHHCELYKFHHDHGGEYYREDGTGERGGLRGLCLLRTTGRAGSLAATIRMLTLVQVAGAACTPIISTPFPLVVGTLGAGQTGSANVTIDFTGCATAARFTATFTFTATNGTVTGTVVRSNQFQ